MSLFERCWQWFVATVLGSFAAFIAAVVISFQCHFAAGGTLGGPGEAPDAHLDHVRYEELFAQRIWIAWVIAALVPTALAISTLVHILFRNRETL
jgi:hypothetical protein